MRLFLCDGDDSAFLSFRNSFQRWAVLTVILIYPFMAEKLYFVQKSGGAVPSPFDCWLMLRRKGVWIL